MKGLTLLIDADVLRYQLAFSNTKTIKWEAEDGEDAAVSEVVNAEKAKADLEDYIDELLEKFGTRDFLLPLSVSTNFRKDILPTYKANRAGKARPALWYAVDGFLKELWPEKIITREYLEGDDILGILQTMPSPRLAPGKRIIVSIDKDMQTLPGRLYNPGKPDIGTRTISQHQADLYWMMQTLTGDTTDNYGGCPGIGPKRADPILQPIHEALLDAPPEEHLATLWAAVVKTYESKGLTSDDALVQARCARILRDGDYDFKTGKVNLWKP
ncbi:phage exonuclease [Luteibacter sp. ME-Dv--P-043b]|uniref:phage exonuclease n=1 Tax=Luteibacter sp. ME-Dv--P-043b TaxID=3040291 RepID=UPI002557C2A8|nr:phage exonuclease [Luteibacter sp. ME-Dv--P-043b]